MRGRDDRKAPLGREARDGSYRSSVPRRDFVKTLVDNAMRLRAHGLDELHDRGAEDGVTVEKEILRRRFGGKRLS